MGYVLDLADVIGVSEPAIKLLLTVYAGYVFALIHRVIPFNSPKTLKLLYFTGIGGFMIFWNYGFDLYHSALCIVVQYVLFQILGGSTLSVALSFIFQLGYLIYGYIFFSTTGYDINWCMPHCILTLRLIGLAFDVYDGHKDKKLVTKEQEERAISDLPSLLEIFGYSYLYCGFLVGPQFPLQRFRDMNNGKLTDNPGHYPNSLLPGFRRGLSGTVVLLVQTYLGSTFYPDFYVTSAYQKSSFFYKFSYLAITGYVSFLRYMGIWMINEGVCILCGLGYRKDEKTGKVYWDSVRNVILRKVLFAESFQDMINSFNINTNAWIMRYVYKRLRFVGIKEVSQAGAMVFLAIWHGIHEGYFTTFAYEFLTMNVEKPLILLLGELAIVKYMHATPALKWIPRLVGFIYLHSLFGYCLIDFHLRKWELFHPVHVSIYYFGHVFYGTLFIFFKLRPIIKMSRKRVD